MCTPSHSVLDVGWKVCVDFSASLFSTLPYTPPYPTRRQSFHTFNCWGLCIRAGLWYALGTRTVLFVHRKALIRAERFLATHSTWGGEAAGLFKGRVQCSRNWLRSQRLVSNPETIAYWQCNLGQVTLGPAQHNSGGVSGPLTDSVCHLHKTQCKWWWYLLALCNVTKLNHFMSESICWASSEEKSYSLSLQRDFNKIMS